MPPEAGIERRVFIVGVPRSGTTLVQSLLASHPSTTSFTETHFFSRYFALVPLLERPILTRDPRPRLRDFLEENDEAPPEAAKPLALVDGRPRWPRPLLPLRTRAVARQLLRVLDELALRHGRSTWIEKTPRHLRYTPFLAGLAGPGTHVVHVVRNGLDVVASLRQASRSWERPYDLDTCVRRWNRDVAFSLGRARSPHDHLVLYEDLTSRPEEALRPLLGALGLDWAPAILRDYGPTSDRLVTGQERWKGGTGRRIRPSEASVSNLNPEERERATRSLQAGLYERVREAARRRSPGGGDRG